MINIYNQCFIKILLKEKIIIFKYLYTNTVREWESREG